VVEFVRHTHPIHRAIGAEVKCIAHRTTLIALLADPRCVLEETHGALIHASSILLRWSESCISESIESSIVIAFGAVSGSFTAFSALGRANVAQKVRRVIN
jgi:hypothetical protein